MKRPRGIRLWTSGDDKRWAWANERIRELQEAERACKAANESQHKTIAELEAKVERLKAESDTWRSTAAAAGDKSARIAILNEGGGRDSAVPCRECDQVLHAIGLPDNDILKAIKYLEGEDRA